MIVNIPKNIFNLYFFLLFLYRAKEYKDFPNEGLLGNFLGVLFVIYAGLVVYMVTKPEYKRQPKPEDGVLLDRSPE